MTRTTHKVTAFLISFVLLFFHTGTSGQEYRFRHLTTEDGLPSNWIYHIAQDSVGFIWISSRAGLCRYDGYDIKVYHYDPEDSTSISNDYVKCNLLADNEGFLWVGTNYGLNRFDPSTEKFKRFYHDPTDTTTISSNLISSIYQDSRGTIWIGTKYPGGLNKYMPETNSFKRYRNLPEEKYSNTYLGLYEDQHGTFWVATKDGLLEFDRDAEKYRLVEASPKITNKIQNRFTKITEDHKGNIWYVGDHVYTYDRRARVLNLFEPIYRDNLIIKNTGYTDIEFDVTGEEPVMWVVNDGKLFKYGFSSGILSPIAHDPTDPQSIMATGLHNLFIDSSGNLWVSGSRGLNVMDPVFRKISTRKDFFKEYGDEALSFLEDSKGSVWIGTIKSGLMQFDREMNLLKWYKSKTIDADSQHFSGSIWKIYEDSENNLWIICNDDGLYHLDRQKNEIIRCELKFNKNEMAPRADEHFIYDVYEDSEGVIWVGARPSLYRREPGQNPKTSFNLVLDPKTLYYYTITSICEDHLQGLWFGVLGEGVFHQPAALRGTQKFIHFFHDANDSSSLSNNSVWSVYEDRERNIWVSTNHGLNKFNPRDQSFNRYLFEQDEGANFIYAVLDDDYGNLWMSTESGLIRMAKADLDGEDHSNLKLDHVLPFSEIWSYKLHTNNQRKIYVGSKNRSGNGYFIIDPEDIRANSHIPPVVLTRLSVHNKPVVLDSSATVISHLQFGYRENSFSFEFAALDYLDPERNLYAYMLEGLDEDWIYAGNRRFASYTKVPPGDYIFRVKGSNNDGYWNETGASVAITVLPPPWKTWWAYTGYGIILIGIIILWRIYDLRRIRLRQQLELQHVEATKLKELDYMKSRFFANISHEFRTPLTLILGPLEKLFNKHRDNESRQEIRIAQQNARSLQYLINQLLTLSRLESGKLKLQARQENLVTLVNGYFQSFESLAKQKNIRIEFDSDKESITLYADREKLEKVLFNLLSNAFKFTPEGGQVVVKVSSPQSPLSNQLKKPDFENGALCQGINENLLDSCAMITVSDTGPGISSDHIPYIFNRFYQAEVPNIGQQEGSGIGLALAKELVELHHGELVADSEVGKGTTFFILLPLGKAHLGDDELDKSGSAPATLSKTFPQVYPVSERQPAVSSIPSEPKGEDNGKPHPVKTYEKDAPLILIVEDNQDLLAYIRGYLVEKFNVAHALDGEEGLTEARRTIPDLVISDVMMPKMDGYTLCRSLKTDERTSHIPLIMLTARGAVEDKLKGLETGADDYIAKPFNPEELLARINNLIHQRKVLREKFINHYWNGTQVRGIQIANSDLNALDKGFLRKALDTAEKHLADSSFDLTTFCREMALSRQQLHRKLRALLDQSPTGFIRNMRLKRAAELLAQKHGTVSEIAYDTGFNTLSYFTKCFKEQFGVSPSEYPLGDPRK